MYLKEHEHIRRYSVQYLLQFTCIQFVSLKLIWCYSSDRLADEAISIAIATKENLSHQRGMFSGAAGRMGAVACIL